MVELGELGREGRRRKRKTNPDSHVILSLDGFLSSVELLPLLVEHRSKKEGQFESEGREERGWEEGRKGGEEDELTL